METIVVEPFAEAWCVKSASVENDLIFRSGADAEAAAKGLAMKLAASGDPVRLQLKVRNGLAPLKFVCLPPIIEGDTPRLVEIPTPRKLDS